MRAKRLALCSSLALASLAPSVARADETSDLEGLLNETVIVGASKSAEAGSTAPAVTTALTSEDIRRYGIHSLDEAIDFLSLGAATSSRLKGAEIGGRGVLVTGDEGNHFLLLINGHTVNEALYGAARFDRGAGIPMELVDRIEVILGPGSVLYGSSAMLGVINVITKSARTFSGTHVVAETEIAKSYRFAAGGGYEFSLFKVPAKLALELEYYQQDGTLKLGRQQQGNNIFTQRPWVFSPGGPADGLWGGTAKNSYYARVPSGLITFRMENFELDFKASTYKRSTPFNHDFVQPESDFDDRDNYEIDRSIYADARYNLPISAVTSVRTHVYGDSFDYRRQADVSETGNVCQYSVLTCRKSAFGASRWVGAEIQPTFDWFKSGVFVTMLGIDGKIRSMIAQNDVLDASNGGLLTSSEGVLRESDRVGAAYLQQTWRPWDELALNAGGRFDFDQRFGQRFSPRVAASVKTWRGGTLKAIYSEAFRAPSWRESAYHGGLQIASEGLRPETVRSIEAALDQKLGAHHLLFGVFRSQWNDLVELHTLSFDEVRVAQAENKLPFTSLSGFQYRNISSIENYGFNAGYDGTMSESKFRYALNVTGAIARRQSELGSDLPLVVAPQLFGNARVAYSFEGEGPTVALATHFFGQRLSDRALEGRFTPTPVAPPFAELRATISGPVPSFHSLLYRVSANYALADQGPYVIGPVQTGARSDGTTRPFALIPIERFRATVGLQYDF